jgi:hypothetical protein
MVGTSSAQDVGASTSRAPPGLYTLPSAESGGRNDVVTGILPVDSHDARILFDSGASFSFVSIDFARKAGLSVERIRESVVVSSPSGIISSTIVCPGCSISIADEVFFANLVMISLDSFDVILGMDWLSQYHAVISCFWKMITLLAPSGEKIIFQGSSLPYTLSLLCVLFPKRWMVKLGALWSLVEG